jgi:hypothetical protein
MILSRSTTASLAGVTLAVLTAAWLIFGPNEPGVPGVPAAVAAPVHAAAKPAEPGGYAAAFDAELRKLEEKKRCQEPFPEKVPDTFSSPCKR